MLFTSAAEVMWGNELLGGGLFSPSAFMSVSDKAGVAIQY